jgi:hypothetical protein
MPGANRTTRRAAVWTAALVLALAGGGLAQEGSDFPAGTGEPSSTFQQSWGKIHGITVDLRGLASFPAAGDAGAGVEAPAFADAFGTGYGGEVKIGFAFALAFGLRADLGGVTYPAKRFTAGGTDNLFSDMNTAHAVLSVELTLPLNVETKAWFKFGGDKTWKGPAVSLSVGGGARYVDHLRWVEPAPTWSFWDASVGGMFVARLGFRYRFTNTFGLVLEGEARLSEPPPQADRSGPRASAGGLWAISVGAGMTFVF